MTTLLLGLLLGFVTVVPLGPMSLSIIGVGLTQGRTAGSQAGLGVVGGDAITASAAVALVGLGARLPAGAFAFLRYCSLAVLAAFGVAMIIGSNRFQAAAGGLRRPGRVLMAATVLSPLTFGSWIAMFMAMPFAQSPSRLGLFATGVMLSSLCWHPLLGAGAGLVGTRVNEGALTVVARLGGLALVALALALALSQV